LPSVEDRGPVAYSPSQGELEPASSVRKKSSPGIPRRLLAWVIDIFVVVVIILVVASVIAALFGPTVRIDRDAPTAAEMVTIDAGLVVLNTLVSIGLSAVYFTMSWTVFGSSPGQLLFRMRVRSTTDGSKLTIARAFARWALLFPPFGTVAALTADAPSLSALVWGSAPIWYLILLASTVRSPTRQGLHDRLARSVVQATGGSPDRRGREATDVR
jgi:hypothetical protein